MTAPKKQATFLKIDQSMKGDASDKSRKMMQGLSTVNFQNALKVRQKLVLRFMLLGWVFRKAS